jgi:D-alanyl-D-alanine carboxypeptidase
MNFVKELLAAALVFGLLCPSHADSVDDFVKRQMRLRQIPGLSLAVVKEGNIIKAKGYGLANVELNVPATQDTIYEIGSVTKVLTATAIVMLVNDGKMRLDDPITNYLSGLPAAWGGVTVRHLLAHTSGITNKVDASRMDLRFPFSTNKLFQAIANSPLSSEPGEKSAYSNTGYDLAGLILERVSGKRYADLLKDRIFDPLGMHSTRVNDRELIITNRASGYTIGAKGEVSNNDYVDSSRYFSAGGVVSSVMDLAKWDAALYTDKLLPKSRLEEMGTPVRLKDGSMVGLGWGIGSTPLGRGLAGQGRMPGFVAMVARWIDQRLTVIVLANQEVLSPWDIVSGVSERYLPALTKPIQDKTPERTKKDRELLMAAMAGTLDQQRFTENLRKSFFPQKANQIQKDTTGLRRIRSFVLGLFGHLPVIIHWLG